MVLVLSTLLGASWAAEVLLEDDFSSGMTGWYVEGGRTVEVKDGRLQIDADPEVYEAGGRNGGVCTVWSRQRLSGDLRVDFDVQVIGSATGTNNINAFLFYSLPDGSSPEATTALRRFADYADYHPLNGYIFTFLNAPENHEAARLRIRRCPGFHLLNETYAYHNRAGVTYRVSLVRRGGALELQVDGELRLQATDPAPLESGYFAFRTFRTKLWFDNLRITRLPRDPG